MDRRSFLRGAAAAAVMVAAPIKIAAAKVAPVVTGTVTGRMSSYAPAMQPLPRHQVKALMYARSYGAGLDGLPPRHINCRCSTKKWIDIDLDEIEKRVAANIAENRDPYTIGALS